MMSEDNNKSSYFRTEAASQERGGGLLRSSGVSVMLRSPLVPVALSAAVHDKVIVQSVGAFTAFCDGRVRVKFFDRTLLEIDAQRRACEILLRNARQYRFSLKPTVSPHAKRLQHYIVPALEFAQWVFLDAHQREQLIHGPQRFVQQQARNTARLMAINRISERQSDALLCRKLENHSEKAKGGDASAAQPPSDPRSMTTTTTTTIHNVENVDPSLLVAEAVAQNRVLMSQIDQVLERTADILL